MSDGNASTSDRPKRPELSRSEPNRTFLGVFGARPGAPLHEPPPHARPTAASEDAVARGVETGYQVIDEYLRQAEAFARVTWPVAPALGNRGDPRWFAERMLQYASDMAAVWFDYVQSTTASMPLGPATNPSERRVEVGGFDLGPAPAARVEPTPAPPRVHVPEVQAARAAAELAAPRVSVALISTQPVEITAELHPGARGAVLRAHELRAVEPGMPNIGGVRVERTGDERVVIHVRVPDDTPKATYSGLIVDAQTNLPRGALSIRVG